MRKIVAFSIFSVVLLSASLAQDGAFVASVSPPKVEAGEQFTVAFTLSGTQMTAVGNFKAPDFGQFVVMSVPNRSESFQIINGRTSASLSIAYYLYVRQPGKYEIGPATIEYKGNVLKTEPVRVEVVAAGKGGSQAQRSAQQSPGALQDIGDNLLIRAVPNKSRVRQGEQFIVAYKLYTRINISDYGIAKVPTYEGFWAEDFEQPKSAEVATETYNGKQYRVVTLKNTALFATQTGSLKISPLEVRCAVQVRRRNNDPLDIFNDPFFSRAETAQYEFKSNSLTIVVDPLPGKAPETFLGAIGSYTFGASLNKSEVKAGDPLTLKLTVSGPGNIRLISIPKPAFPSDLETYEPRVSEEISRDNQIIRGKKIAEYLLIPRNAGQRVIEPLVFTFYDLQKNSYVTLRSPRFELTITAGREPSSTAGGFASKEDVRMLGEDIRFIKLSPGAFQAEEASPFGTLWFQIGMILPPILFAGAYGYRKRREMLLGDLSLLRSQKAGREATKRLKIAQKILAQGNTESYHAEISRALLSYLSDKLRIPVASLTIESTMERLVQRGVLPDMIRQVTSCIERAEFARFAPGSDTQEARKDLLETATRAIEGLEKSLNGRS